MKSFTLYPIGTVKAEGETAALQLDAAYIPGLDGLEGFSHLVVLWWFDRCDNPQDRAMVRQLPHTGPKKERGTFSTRSPRRPNPIALSVVKVRSIDYERGKVLIDSIEAQDGTPILDIKPYLAYTDAHLDAAGGFAYQALQRTLPVDCPPTLLARLPEDRREALLAVLAQDPRPGYQNEAGRVYGFPFAGFEVRFTVADGRLTVVSIQPAEMK